MNKKIIVSILGVLVLTAGVGVGVYLVQQRQEIRKKAAPATTLAFSPSNTSPNVDATFTVAVNINTGENQVVGTELYLNFDAARLEAQSMSAGSFFTSPQVVGPTINNTTGTLSYTLYLAPGATPQQGSGTVASITFKTKSAGTANIGFASNTLVGAVGEGGQNVLTSSTGTSVNIQGATTSTTSSSPTATANPTSSPTSPPTGGGTSQTTPPAAAKTPTPTAKSRASATAAPTLPESGTNLPTLIGLGSGLILLLVSAALAL